MKKKIFLLPLLASMLLGGCSSSGNFFASIGDFFKGIFGTKDKDSGDGGEVIPPDTDIHANKLKLEPSAPFYLKVGETKDIEVGFDYKPTQESERIFIWSFNGDKISLEVEGATQSGKSIKGGTKAKVTGNKSGTVELNVQNTYNEALTGVYTIKVIDFDEDNDYLWEYSSEDRAQFGYEYPDKKMGTDHGDATLNGITWSYTRSEVTSLQSSMSAVGFGKGQEPETSVHLETTIDRVVKDITLECASTNSLATLTITVNGEEYPLNENQLVDGKIPRAYYDVIQSVSTTGEGTQQGKIELDFLTPPFDSSRAEDPTYKAPGALYLKSILIHFGEAKPDKTTEVFNFKEMYDDPEDGVFDTLVKSSSKEVAFTQGDYEVYMSAVKKESDDETEKIPGYAHTNGFIDVKLNKSDEVISKVEFGVQYGTTEDKYKTQYSLEVSKLQGAPYVTTNVLGDKDTGLLKVNVYQDNINSIHLVPSKSNLVGLDYLKISTREGINPTIKEYVTPDVLEPTTKEYQEGDLFDITGLPDLSIVFNEDGIESESLSPKELDWYDGVLYDKDPRVLSKQLVEGTTYVYGVFRDKVVATVNGLTVVSSPLNLTLVKSADDIVANAKYLIVGESEVGFTCLNGAETSTDAIKNGYALVNFEVTENVVLSSNIETRCFIASFDDSSKLLFESAGGYKVGLTKGGDLSCTKSPALLGWDFEINASNELVMTMYDGKEPSTLKEFGVNKKSGKFSAYTTTSTSKGVIYLYKIAE